MKKEARKAEINSQVTAFLEATADVTAARRVEAARAQLAQEAAERAASASITSLKLQILLLARDLERGAIGLDANGTVTDDKHLKLAALVEELERSNPTPWPLNSPLLSCRWQLCYTTSQSILGVGKRMRPEGPIYQSIDVPTLSARNDETARIQLSRRWRRLGVRLRRFVEADLVPMSASKVTVKFKRFGLGPFRFRAPASAVGELDTTYLDEEFRISRGDKGNLFVLTAD